MMILTNEDIRFWKDVSKWWNPLSESKTYQAQEPEKWGYPSESQPMSFDELIKFGQ